MRFTLSPSFRWTCSLLCSLASTTLVAAQYGDAYHAPDYNRLRQMADARATAAMNEHYARIAPTRQTGSSATGAARSGAPDGNSWAMTGRINAQRRDGARVDARLAAFEAKDARLRALIAERKLRIAVDDFDRLIQAALDAGFDAYYASRRFGASRAEFTARQAMIAASFNPEPTGARSSGPVPPDCQGACSTTIVASDGSVYTGNIRAGAPDGRGRYQRASGDVYIGTFVGGRMNGPMRIEYADGAVYEGATANNQLEGQGTLTFRDGGVSTGRFEKGRQFSGRSEIGDTRDVFEGIFDSLGAPSIGTYRARTWSFTGEFRNGMRSRGTIELPDQVQVGTFDALGRLRAGRVTIKSGGDVTDGFYDEQTKRHGYAVDVFADGSSNEQIFDHDRLAGPVIRTRNNGEVITGMTNVPGYQIFGVMRSTNGVVTPTALTSDGAYVVLPAAQHDRARALAAQAAATLLTERTRYRATIEQAGVVPSAQTAQAAREAQAAQAVQAAQATQPVQAGPRSAVPAAATQPVSPADSVDITCTGGNGRACTALGVMYTDGDRVAIDLVRGAMLFQKACVMDDPRGCMLWGYALHHGRGVTADFAQALIANERSCSREYGLGCNNLGSMLQQGHGAARDEKKAFDVYAKACALRTGVGCRNVGILHADAVTLPHDRTLAVAAFDKGCQFGDLSSCNKQAWHLEQGLGTDRDVERARRLYAKACDGGFQLACTNARNLRSR